MAPLLSHLRRPLSTRTLPNSPSKATRIVSGSKRARSPEHGEAQGQRVLKRARVLAPPPVIVPTRDLRKERERKTEREQQEAEFREKYTRAFPTWKFYFDTEKPLSISESSLKSRVLSLGSGVVDFFDKTVTHVITDADIPSQSYSEANPDKENSKISMRKILLSFKSPIKHRHRNKEEKKNSAIQQAITHGMKIWNTGKLDSVLTRCLKAPISKHASTSQRPSLSKLLQAEKIHGTNERDPTQKRYNYKYFTAGSCFVLLEDINQELATIAAHEYPIVKDKDPNSKKPWPVLHCHPHARNPFAPFDEKEKRRWDRQQKAEMDEEDERAQRRRQREIEALKRRAASGRQGDLRRSVSFNNIQRRLPSALHDLVDLDADADDLESANASGYLASGAGVGYVAASGNSVGITSTTGTTSNPAHFLRSLKLPASINERIKQQVVTNFKVAAKGKTENAGLMGPPALPSRHQGIIKRSKSTNTMKLPKREEGVKPGYCESCRMKFEDFSEHVGSKKHLKFASNIANFEALDYVLNRLRRRTRVEVEAEERRRLAMFKARMLHQPSPPNNVHTFDLSTP